MASNMRAVDDIKSTRELVISLNHTRNELRVALEVLDAGFPPSEKEVMLRMVITGLLATNSPYRDERKETEMTYTSRGAALISRAVNEAIANGSPVVAEQPATPKRNRYQVKINSGETDLDRANSLHFDTLADAQDYATRLLATYDDPDNIGMLIYDWQDHRNYFAR